MREWLWPWCIYTCTLNLQAKLCNSGISSSCQGMATQVVLLWVQTRLFSATLVTSCDCLWESIEFHIFLR